jgi:dihydrofolate reductase
MNLTVHTFVTLDGVMQSPGAADEDPSNGFEHGGWIVPLADADMGTTVSGWFEKADEILIGRGTYDKMFPYWSQVTDPDDFIARQLNTLPKHIVSRTLRSPEWRDSTVISGDVVATIEALKARPGRELQVHGSAQLVQTLNEHNLVDEYRLLVFPLVLGTGKRLFGDRTTPTGFETVDCKTTSTGAVALTLRPAGAPAKADFVIQAGEGTHES